MNTAVRSELDSFNSNEFQKRKGSRLSVFKEEEFPFIQPLPHLLYEYANWKTAKVQLNYHISMEYQYYSVPYQYVKKSFDIRFTKYLIEIIYKGSRICSHKRLIGKRGEYSTLVDHMPPNHQLYSKWDSQRFLSWGEKIGKSTRTVIEKIYSHTE